MCTFRCSSVSLNMVFRCSPVYIFIKIINIASISNHMLIKRGVLGTGLVKERVFGTQVAKGGSWKLNY